MHKIKSLYWFILLGFIAACGYDLQTTADTSQNSQTQNTLATTPIGEGIESGDQPPLCPLPSKPPAKVAIEVDADDPVERPIEPNREVNDLVTNFVVQNFFTTKESLFNFMTLVYGNVEKAMDKFRQDLGLEERAITVLAKGGNILRLLANKVLSLITPEARKLLHDEYMEKERDFFKRSDADFSVYVDESRLNGRDYERTFDEINEIVFNELNAIRDEFVKNPDKYFDLFQIKPQLTRTKLKQILTDLADSDAVSDEENNNWYQATFNQIQLIDQRANTEPRCEYHGEHDFRMISQQGKTLRLRASAQPSWITNTENRTIEVKWATDPSKVVKFYLSRSKVALELLYQKDGETKRKSIVGELVDISLPHRKDAGLIHFLENYDDNVATYTLSFPEKQEKLSFKAYSLGHNADDLALILFESSIRPWVDIKYPKRVNRLFFIYIVELMGRYGIGGGPINTFVKDVQEHLIAPAEKIFPITEDSRQILEKMKASVEVMQEKWVNLPIANKFFGYMYTLISNMLDSPEDNDQPKFTEFLAVIKRNLDNASRIGRMTPWRFDIQEIYNVDIDHFL